MEPIIKTNKLNVTYFPGKSNEVKALKDINIEIFPGEFVIFFGPSGCGKSTLLYSISGLEKNVDGEIHVNGKDIRKMNNNEREAFLQTETGMIFQAFYLINSLNVVGNVALPQVAVGKSKKERETNAMKLLEHFGVGQQAKKYPNEISGGQQQRVAICRAIINDPQIIFADEPVGNLDSKSANDVMELLKDLNKKQKKTVILVTHSADHLNMAHRIFYVKDGVIVRTEVNEPVDDKLKEEDQVSGKISRELELLARTFNDLDKAPGFLLVPFKAKQIVAEALTGLSESEIGQIEKAVETMLIQGVESGVANLFEVIDSDRKLALDKRTATKITNKIKEIVREIKIMEKEERMISLENRGFAEEVQQLSQYLLTEFKLDQAEIAKFDLFNQAIAKRLKSEIDHQGFLKMIDLPIKEGGVGLDKRLARKLAQRVELLILGKYK